MSSLRERNLLYARLEEVLGAEPAEVLMNQFPTESDLATRFDVTNLGTRFNGLETRFDGLEARFDSLETRFDGLEVRLDALEGRVDQIDAIWIASKHTWCGSTTNSMGSTKRYANSRGPTCSR